LTGLPNPESAIDVSIKACTVVAVSSVRLRSIVAF
jgi:hypothetical protein